MVVAGGTNPPILPDSDIGFVHPLDADFKSRGWTCPGSSADPAYVPASSDSLPQYPNILKKQGALFSYSLPIPVTIIPGHQACSKRTNPLAGPQPQVRDKRIAVSERESTRQKTLSISANVQPIFTDGQLPTFGSHGFVFGCASKPSTLDCGVIISRVTCTADPEHKPYFKHQHCNDPLCPVCYSKFTNRIAEAVTDRVEGYRSVYPRERLYHTVFWPAIDVGYPNLKAAFAHAKIMLEKMGAVSATAWFHPWAIKDEIKERLRKFRVDCDLDNSVGFWQMVHDDVLGLGSMSAYLIYRPHFHAILSGYLMNATDYKQLGEDNPDLGLGGYKKGRLLDTDAKIEQTARYISTHACYEAKRSTVRYYGKISYSKLSRDEGQVTVEDVVCVVCGKPLIEHYYNSDLGIETGVAHDHVTRKVTRYKYWKPGEKYRGLLRGLT